MKNIKRWRILKDEEYEKMKNIKRWRILKGEEY